MKSGTDKWILRLTLAALLLAGCGGPRTRLARNAVDTPAHHCYSGTILPGRAQYREALAAKEKVTRAELCAILMRELTLPHIYRKDDNLLRVREFWPEDIKSHPLQYDVRRILQMGLRGLEVFPDSGFHPDEPITRADYAMLIEDIIAMITRERDLHVRYIDAISPFSDIAPDAPYLNAVMVCTGRGFLEADDFEKGTFNPAGFVKGTDVLFTIKRIKLTYMI